MTEAGLRHGVMPVAPTIFDEDEALDLDGQCRVVDYLVAAEVDAICILANYSEQFSLDDGERVAIMEASMGRAAGRVPIIVTTSHFSARVAAARTRDACERGASIAMLMAPFFGTSVRATEDDVVEYFKRVAGDLEIDLMIQDAPMSATPLPVSLLARIAREVSQVRYVKVEVPQAATKLRALKVTAGESLPGLFDGEEGVTLIHDLDAGAIGTMPSCLVPHELGGVVRSYQAGRRDEAVREWERLLPLIHFENRHLGLQATKILLKDAGIIASDRVRSPLPIVSDAIRGEFRDLVRRLQPFALGWAASLR
jgi:2-keto-3-deoxy-L-arabinonate dehydratase